jgi:hypothetical protein
MVIGCRRIDESEPTIEDFGSEATPKIAKKRKFCNLMVEGTSENVDYHTQSCRYRLTFFSLSIHLVMAGTLEPVRSFKAVIASLTSKMVAMVFAETH